MARTLPPSPRPDILRSKYPIFLIGAYLLPVLGAALGGFLGYLFDGFSSSSMKAFGAVAFLVVTLALSLLGSLVLALTSLFKLEKGYPLALLPLVVLASLLGDALEKSPVFCGFVAGLLGCCLIWWRRRAVKGKQCAEVPAAKPLLVAIAESPPTTAPVIAEHIPCQTPNPATTALYRRPMLLFLAGLALLLGALIAAAVDLALNNSFVAYDAKREGPGVVIAGILFFPGGLLLIAAGIGAMVTFLRRAGNRRAGDKSRA